MSASTNNTIVFCEPHTIWALDECDRPAAVIALFNECAGQFRDAVQQGKLNDASDLAICGLASIAGLFPDPNNAAHVLLNSLTGMLVDAKSGRTGHVLTRSTKPIRGINRGFGHTYVGGFAISAVNMLVSAKLLSVRQAGIAVAGQLAGAGCSLRKGEHAQPKPITASAIRNWRENSADYPTQHAIAAEMVVIHRTNLAARAASSKADVLAYFKDQAVEAVQHARNL